MFGFFWVSKARRDEIVRALVEVERERLREDIERLEYAARKKELLAELGQREALRVREEQEVHGLERWIEINSSFQVATTGVQEDLCEEALRVMRSFIPIDIRHCSLEELRGRGLSKEVATRIFNHKTLWLCVTPKDEIQRFHLADLLYKYDNQGLDLIEMRAVWFALPAFFRFDHMAKKSEWHSAFRIKLLELERKAFENRLLPHEERHPAYAHSQGIFDPELPLISTLSPPAFSGLRKRLRSISASSSAALAAAFPPRRPSFSSSYETKPDREDDLIVSSSSKDTSTYAEDARQDDDQSPPPTNKRMRLASPPAASPISSPTSALPSSRGDDDHPLPPRRKGLRPRRRHDA